MIDRRCRQWFWFEKYYANLLEITMQAEETMLETSTIDHDRRSPQATSHTQGRHKAQQKRATALPVTPIE